MVEKSVKHSKQSEVGMLRCGVIYFDKFTYTAAGCVTAVNDV